MHLFHPSSVANTLIGILRLPQTNNSLSSFKTLNHIKIILIYHYRFTYTNTTINTLMNIELIISF